MTAPLEKGYKERAVPQRLLGAGMGPFTKGQENPPLKIFFVGRTLFCTVTYAAEF